MEIAFVPVVPAPWLVGHVLDREALVRRKRNVRQRPGAAFLDCELKYGIEFFLRNQERLSPFLISLPQRVRAGLAICAGNFPLELSENLIKVRIRTSCR